MTTAIFKHIDPTSYTGKPWGKVDGPGRSFTLADYKRTVSNIRTSPTPFTTDNAGFQLVRYPAHEKSFTDETAIRNGYYSEVESLLKNTIKGVKKVVIFDHTIRRRKPDAPRQPVQQVHVDQTPGAADVRVRRHAGEEAEALLKNRYALINVWRPIENPASDFPLAVVDWRSTRPADFVPVDLMYPKRSDSPVENGSTSEGGKAKDDDGFGDPRGKEALPNPESYDDTTGYEVKGETLGVAASEGQRFWYAKDMTPEEVLLLKCYDNRAEDQPEGRKGIARGSAHTAFEDPNTPEGSPGRQSIEVRCLVFYEDGF